jgi:hypothetical protein
MPRNYPYNGPDHDAMLGVGFPNNRIKNGLSNNQDIMELDYRRKNFSFNGTKVDVSYKSGLGSGFILSPGEGEEPKDELRIIIKDCFCDPKKGDLLKGGRKIDSIVEITERAFIQLEKLADQ